MAKKNKGSIEITDLKTGEVVFSWPFAPEMFHWAKLALEGAENKNGVDKDGDALAYFAAYTLAELQGKKIAELPDTKDITPMDLLTLAMRYHIDLDDGTGDEDGGDVVENPTDTKPVSA